jgi:serralysin
MSIQSQVDAASVGAVVLIAAGTFNENVYIGKSVILRGAVDANGKPLSIIAPSGGWNGIHVKGHNVTIENFQIINAPGDGIAAEGVHHTTIRNCKIRECGESGIQFDRCDWFLVENCELIANAETGWFSGISAYQNKVLATGTLIDGYRNVIRNIIAYGQDTRGGNHTDGNGIIIDDFNNTQGGGQSGGYTHGCLVENCLLYNNDGKGLQITWSNNVTARKITAVNNNRDLENTGTWRGDISVSQSKGVKLEDCLAVTYRGTGRLANNRAYDNTSTTNAFNTTTFLRNIGWDASGTPSVRTDSGNVTPVVTWVNPGMSFTQAMSNPSPSDFIPTITTTAGWRPTGGVIVPDPEPEPEPEPDPDPDLTELTARVTAVEAKVAALETISAQQTTAISALTSRVTALEGFDTKIKDL